MARTQKGTTSTQEFRVPCCPECRHQQYDQPEHFPDCRYFVVERDDDDDLSDLFNSFVQPAKPSVSILKTAA